MKEQFRIYAAQVATAMGNPWAFLTALTVIIIWAATGPLFHFSDTWQLVINTSTTIVTFLMVFLIQNTQNRDGKAIDLKLDELIRSMAGARNDLMDLERLSDDELEELHQEFLILADANDKSQRRVPPDGPPGAARPVRVVHRVASAVEHALKKRRPHHHSHKK